MSTENQVTVNGEHRGFPPLTTLLDIVRALASECGIDGDQGGRTIWARFDWTE